jgi:DNA-binding GntR family transcriptional regulator
MAMSGAGRRKDLSPYERIKHAILDGTFEPGEFLIEATVSEWCGVSRTPVREALSRLEQDGMVIRTGKGVSVRERTPDEILDLYDTRISLEVTAARFAAQRRTQIDQVRIERMCAAAEEVDENASGPVLAEANRNFHRVIWQASHNQAVLDLLDRVNLHLMRWPQTILTSPGRWKVSLEEHREMVEALRVGDEDKVAMETEKHFTAARNLRLALWMSESSSGLSEGMPRPESSGWNQK